MSINPAPDPTLYAKFKSNSAHNETAIASQVRSIINTFELGQILLKHKLVTAEEVADVLARGFSLYRYTAVTLFAENLFAIQAMYEKAGADPSTSLTDTLAQGLKAQLEYQESSEREFHNLAEHLRSIGRNHKDLISKGYHERRHLTPDTDSSNPEVKV